MFARRRGGRILLFGSAARGELTDMSNIDVLIDVPSDAEADAWVLAEHLSRLHDIPVDIHSARTTRPEFIRRIEASEGARVTRDARWHDVDAEIADAVQHFGKAVQLTPLAGSAAMI